MTPALEPQAPEVATMLRMSVVQEQVAEDVEPVPAQAPWARTSADAVPVMPIEAQVPLDVPALSALAA